MEALRKFYVSKHYHRVEIVPLISQGIETNTRKIEFKINRGKKLKI